jgi:hypothetical protein
MALDRRSDTPGGVFGDRKIFPQISSRGHLQGSERLAMEARLRVPTCHRHITCELFQTPKLRCDNRARAQVCATAGAVTLACRTNRRRIGMPIERVEIAASRCASHARSSFFPTPRALRELYSVTRLTTACAAGRKNHRISIFRLHQARRSRRNRCALTH